MYDRGKAGEGMQEVRNKLKLSLDRPLSRCSVSVKKNDTFTRTLYITLVNNGSVYVLDNVQVAAVKAVKPDGHRIYNTCIIRDNEIIYQMTNQTICVPGTVHCELKLFGYDGETLTTAEFSIEVYENLFDDGELESVDEYNIFDNPEAQDIIRAELTAHTNDAGMHTTEANEAWQTLIHTVQGHTTSLELLNNQVNGISESVSDLSGTVSGMQSTMGGMGNTVSSLDIACADLGRRVTAIENELNGSLAIVDEINELIGGQT